MANSKSTFLRTYFSVMQKIHLKEFIVNTAAIMLILADIIINTGGGSSFLLLNLIAVIILSLYVLCILKDTWDITINVIKNTHVSYSLCLDKSRDSFEHSLRQQKSVLNQQKINLEKTYEYYRIIDIDWQFYEKHQTKTQNWIETTQHIIEHFLRYVYRIPITASFHLFLILPVPIAIGLGFRLGKQRSCIVYNFNTETQEYILIQNNEKNKENSYIEVVEFGSKNSQEITVVLSFIAPARINLPKITNQTITIKPQTKNKQLPFTLFHPIAKEISHLLNELVLDGKTVHLFAGVPTTLGFLIGKELSENSNVLIYNPNRDTDTWDCVIDLQELS